MEKVGRRSRRQEKREEHGTTHAPAKGIALRPTLAPFLSILMDYQEQQKALSIYDYWEGKGCMKKQRRPLGFGIKTAQQHATHDALLDVWQEADAIPIFEHACACFSEYPLSPGRGSCLAFAS